MYLDESGDHNLNPKRINPKYPIFVLGGVIVDRAYVRDQVEPALREFKRKHFGRDDVILHTVDMGRGGGDYAFLDDPVRRADFYNDLNALLQELDYKVVACVIDKLAHIAQYGSNAIDPYMYSLDILVERFCLELGLDVDGGFICAEKRGPSLDRELMAAWEDIRSTTGTGYKAAVVVDARIVAFDLRDKKPNLAGLQLADLVITPVGRHVTGRPEKADQVRWAVVESKLRRVGGSYEGKGLVIRP